MATINFNASEVEPTTELDPVPAGRYLAVLVESMMAPTRAANGSYLQLKFQILEGQYRGRTLWTRLNLANPNETAVKIARGQLSALCRAVGVLAPRDSSELHNLPVVLVVRVKRRKDNGELSNEISGYEPKSAANGKPAASALAPATPGSAPWKR